MSVIIRLLESIFGKTECRVLLLGLDSVGKTTTLYKLKMPWETIPTIPTIGFNVEEVKHNACTFTLWDIGGCDKIRPLWRHYFQNTQAIIWIVDSTDRDNLASSLSETKLSANAEELHRLLQEEELRDTVVLVLANKQDIEGAMSVAEISQALQLDSYTSRTVGCLPGCATSGNGLLECLEWVDKQLKNKKGGGGSKTGAAPSGQASVSSSAQQAPPEEESLLVRWLEQEDEPDDEFLSKVDDYTLDTWDHRAHLRLAWLCLIRHGRREGMRLIFARIKAFIENSPLAKRKHGTTFHETMTYFWAHMVHYAISTSPKSKGNDSFKTFLVLNPQLCNGGLFLQYYSKQLMLNSPQSRAAVVLPDIKPLPSLITDVSQLPVQDLSIAAPAAAKLSRSRGSAAEDSDESFLEACASGTLPRWNHECLLRLVFCQLARYGRQRGVAVVMDALRGVQREHFHLTIAYFWVQMVSLAMAHTPQGLPSDQGYNGDQMESFSSLMASKQLASQKMREFLADERLYLQFYTPDAIYSKKAEKEFVLPDKKQLPNRV